VRAAIPPAGLFPGLAPTLAMSREWAMPSADTLSIPPVAAFAARWLKGAAVVVDPFARDSLVGTLRNDLNSDTAAQYHEDAVAFLDRLLADGVSADAAILDPPYSPRQIAECYDHVGRERKGMEDTQHPRLISECRNRVARIVRPGGCVLSFGWNSGGMGTVRGFALREIVLVAHGGSHNDTICVAEVRAL
jgi:hypothetical protein